MNPVSLLRSPWAATLALALCMWAQIPHSQHVFERLANDQSSGMAFAWGFEAAVLMFVVRNMHIASWFFAGLSALINVKYYEMGGTPMWGGALGATWGQWLIALANPFVIAMYSHVLAHVSNHASAPLWWYEVRGWVQGYVDTVQLWMQPAPATPAIADATLSPAPMQPPVAEAEPMQGDAIEDMQAGDEDAQPPLHVDPKERAKNMSAEGFSNNAIAKELGVNPSTVGRWLNGKEKVQG